MTALKRDKRSQSAEKARAEGNAKLIAQINHEEEGRFARKFQESVKKEEMVSYAGLRRARALEKA